MRDYQRILATGVEDDHYDTEWLSSESLASSQLNQNESVTSVTVHLGMLRAVELLTIKRVRGMIPSATAEVYAGTFNLANK